MNKKNYKKTNITKKQPKTIKTLPAITQLQGLFIISIKFNNY